MYNNKFLNVVKNKIRERKKIAEDIADKNLNTALSSPEFKELYKKERELTSVLAKKMAFGEKVDMSELSDIKEKQKSALAKLSLNLEDLKPKYTCDICNDTGIYENNFCECVKAEMSKNLLEKTGYKKDLQSFEKSNFDLFDKETKDDTIMFYDKMKQWCNKDSKIKNILICGATGIGKTYLLECMTNELISNNKYAIMTTAFNLNQNFLKYHTTFNESKIEYLEPYLDCDVLLIDDLGTEPLLNNVTLDYLYLVINQRNIENKAIVISTNLDIEELMQRYGERITSRLINKQTSISYKIKDNDLRLEKCNK